MSHTPQQHPSFSHSKYLIRRKVFSFLGAKMHIYDEGMNLLLFIKMKAFKLKEDITIFADEEMSQPLVAIRARSIIDLGATYDVLDISRGGEQPVGALRRKGLKSILRDEWEILGPTGQSIGTIKEDSGSLALLRRVHEIFSLVVPQKYVFTVNGVTVGHMRRRMNPFIMKMDADFSADTGRIFDRRLAATAAALLTVIEGRQS